MIIKLNPENLIAKIVLDGLKVIRWLKKIGIVYTK